jgi:hypothetical protein
MKGELMLKKRASGELVEKSEAQILAQPGGVPVGESEAGVLCAQSGR